MCRSLGGVTHSPARLLIHPPNANSGIFGGGSENVIARGVDLESINPSRMRGDRAADGARHQIIDPHLPK